MSYHKKEFEKVDPYSTPHTTMFQVRNENGQTKWMDLHIDSIVALTDWLKFNYPNIWEKYVKDE